MKIAKVIVIAFLTLPPIIMKGQPTTLFGENYFKTKGGIDVSMEMYDKTKELQLTIRYKDFHYDEKITALWIYIPYSNIEKVKSDIKQIERKYKEWAAIAEQNNVESFSKEMPVSISISNIKRMWSMHLAEPENKSIKAIFGFDFWGTPICTLRFNISGYHVSQTCDMELSEDELTLLCEAIDKTVENHKKRVDEWKKTDDLFH